MAIVRYPTASNLDEFRLLEQVAQVVWAREPRDLDDAALVVLPGSKHVAGDLDWVRRSGVDAAIESWVSDGGRLIGICGGLQLLGAQIEDPYAVDGSGEALNLLPLITTFARDKLTQRREARFASLAPPWQVLSGLDISGYEIRHGRTRITGAVVTALPDGLGFARGPILGVYLHGLLEDPAVVKALIGEAPARSLADVFDELADAAERHLVLEQVEALLGASV